MDYKTLDDTSRVWVYQSSRNLNDDEVQEIKALGAEFVAKWAAHGSELKASLEVFYNRFIVIFADETHVHASGCSIDSSVHFMQKIQALYQLDLFDRLDVAFKTSKGIDSLRMNDFQMALEKGQLDKKTIVFNNLVETKGAFVSEWEVPVSKSWHKQLIA